MCSLWIVNYKHTFIIAINLLLLAVFIFILNNINDIKYQLCYLKRSLCTQKFYLFIVASFFLLLLVLFLCLLKIAYYWICCVPVYCACMVLIFYPFTQIFIISHKGTIFSQNNNSVSECIFFSGTKMYHRNLFIRIKYTLFP